MTSHDIERQVFDAARVWFDAGCSVWPAAEDGTKRPVGEWKQFMVQRPPLEQVQQILSSSKRTGIGVICGKVSGNLEMLELEAEASHSVAIDKIIWEAQAHGVEWLWDVLTSGYSEWTPSGGLHMLYRIEDHEVPGNTKIARRPATTEELAKKPDDKIKTLSETRGEGGYVIVTPSGGKVHPSGEAWTAAMGRPDTMPTIRWDDRCKLHEAIHAALDEMPPEPEWIRPPAPSIPRPLDAQRPGDDFQLRATWEEILEPHGWRVHHRTPVETFWTRPGKKRIEGWSASSGLMGTGKDDRLYVWSSSTEFATERPYSKFGAYALLEHGGDFNAAARTLGQRGYGDQSVRVAPGKALPLDHDVHPDPTPSAGQDAAPPAARPVTPPVRERVVVNGDRWEVMQELSRQLIKRWDRGRLFSYGGVVCQREGVSMTPVSKELLDAVVAETCMTMNVKVDRRKGHEGEVTYSHALPEARVLGALLAMPQRFSRLDKLSQIPFVRPDGTICTDPGYDESTHTFLELDHDLHGLTVPVNPSPEVTRNAVDLLMGELLTDFPFHTQADRANALATLLTPFVRDLIPTSPLAVIDAKEAGSGKNLLGDIISIMITGKSAQPLPYTTDDPEQRKVITSAFRSGVSMLLFDEAHELEGASFARALTSHSYQDRILGMSNLAEFPNNRTWISLGNQVQVRGDMARRVYRVRLEYPGASPENRPAEEFRHPDLRQWALDHRRELVAACLTLVRAWFANGKPAVPLAFRMGSFERWQETLAGILAVAQVDGFLGNTKQWRSESDFERQHWVSHLVWLGQKFGEQEFTAAEVMHALRQQRDGEHPHDMNDPFQEGYARRLGQAYARIRDRILDGLQLIKLDKTGHDNVGKWKILMRDNESGSGASGPPQPGGHLFG